MNIVEILQRDDIIGGGDKNQMRTTKLYLAAALIALGAGLQKIDKSDPRHMEFYLTFSGPFTVEKDWFDSQVKLWESRELNVNAQDYVDAIQKLKGEVHKS